MEFGLYEVSKIREAISKKRAKEISRWEKAGIIDYWLTTDRDKGVIKSQTDWIIQRTKYDLAFEVYYYLREYRRTKYEHFWCRN